MNRGNNLTLTAIDSDKADDILTTITSRKWLLSVLKYFGLNYVFSNAGLKELLTGQAHKMFTVTDETTKEIVGIAGLKDVDLIQKRAQLILFHERSRDKSFYGPVKALLEKAFVLWNLTTVTAVLYTDNVYHRPMLKGFGFTSAGVMKEFTEYEDELYDIELFYLQKKHFNVVEV